MNAYLYQGALICEDCAVIRRGKLHPELVALADDLEDDNFAPMGPYPDGGGPADKPLHCDDCDAFLCNPLTPAGYAYVLEATMDKSSHDSTIRELVCFYR